MQRFDFKLSGLLKLREFKEQKIKVELGEIVREIQRLKEENVQINQDIDEAYRSQEKLMEKLAPAQMLEFYPYFIKGKKEHIKYNETLLYTLSRKYDEKISELKKAMGDVKIIENLKQKQFDEYRYESEKKEQADLEELFLMKRARGI